MNIPNHGDHERAHWAAAKLQARFRGKKTRSFTNSKKLAVLRASCPLKGFFDAFKRKELNI